MSNQVNVDDLEVFRLFRAALLKFAQAAEQSLSSADSQIASTHSWLESEQATYWQSQLRKRTEAVARARETLRQKKIYKDSSGRRPNPVEEEKILLKCLAAVEQAEQKIEAVRKWLPRLERAADLYRGGVARLRVAVMDDIPKAVGLLDRLAASLEGYVQIASAGGVDAAEASASPVDASMSRGDAAAGDSGGKGDAAASAEATENQNASATPPPAETPARKEAPDVPDGK